MVGCKLLQLKMITEIFTQQGGGDVKKIICYKKIIVIASLLFCHPFGVEAGELRPFVLPESRQPSVQMEQRGIPQRSPSETPSVYVQFQDDVSRMTAEDRQRLARHYRELRSQAVKDGDMTRINYYDNLLGILNRY